MRAFCILGVVVLFGLLRPAGAAAKPNVVVILVDDLGWSDLPCYGGEISTPNIDALAATGMRFREFYVTPRCAPSRASLLTGLYSHQVADDPANALPSLVNTNNVTMAELLRANGYTTYMAGKWNLGTGALLPENRGFQQVWRFKDGASHSENSWDITRYQLVSPNGEIAEHLYNGAGQQFYQSDAIGDYAVDFINHDLAKGGGAPFFIYMAFGAPHFPLGAPSALANTYTSTYAKGWDVIRQERYDRQLANGVIDSRYPFPPLGGTAPHDAEPIEDLPVWSSLPADRQADLTRRMALYAAMVQKIDENVGKVVARLQATGQLDNTLIFFMSDNGADHEFGKFGTWTGTATGPALTGSALSNMGQPGANDAIKYGGGWAHVSNTPLRLFKHHAHEGGIRAPLIVHWPAGFTAQNTWSEANGDIIDIMPTVVAATGAAYPTTYNSHAVLPMEGTSLLPALNGNLLPQRSLYVEHESNRMVRNGDWKLVTKNFTLSDGSSIANERELYDLSLDPGESNNVASAHPTLVVQLSDAWNVWANRVHVPAARLFPALPLNVTPGQTDKDLFLDTFNRPNATDIDSSAVGMSGSIVPPMGANAAWFEGFEGSGTVDSILVSDNILLMANGPGMSENGVRHNFIDQSIIDAGGFSVSLRIIGLNTDISDAANRYAGFGVGLNAAQAAAGNDINANVVSPRPIRGTAANPGVSDCFVELDLNGNVKVWMLGVLKATVPVGANSGTLTAGFELSGFGTGNTVTVSVYFNGKRVDLVPGAAADTLSFNWNEANANYVALSARASNYAQLDNFAVRRLPLASALAVEYAIGKGLDGVNAAPTANPDSDHLNNFGEWSAGSGPTTADDFVSGTVLTFNDPLADGFRFAHRRLTDFRKVGLSYRYSVSSDLKTWQVTTPTVVSVTPLSGSPGYEVVELRLPDSDVIEHQRLFVRVETIQ